MIRSVWIGGMLALLTAAPAQAQEDIFDELPRNEFSIGLKAGLADMWGDIGTKSRARHYFNGQYFQKPHFMAGVMARYTATPWLAIRLEASAGSIYATDSWNVKDANEQGVGSNAYALYMRNQDMKSTIIDGLLNLEVSPLKLFKNSRVSRWPIQPVLVGGIGVFHFNPKTTYQDPSGGVRWVETQPLHLEGEGLNRPGSPAGYELTQMCIPVGAGLQYAVGSHLTLGFEYVLRITRTDYLDGVSNNYVDPAIFSSFLGETDAAIARQVYNKSGQLDPTIGHPPGDIRGRPENNDAYSTMSFQLIYRFPSQRDRL